MIACESRKAIEVKGCRTIARVNEAVKCHVAAPRKNSD